MGTASAIGVIPFGGVGRSAIAGPAGIVFTRNKIAGSIVEIVFPTRLIAIAELASRLWISGYTVMWTNGVSTHRLVLDVWRFMSTSE